MSHTKRYGWLVLAGAAVAAQGCASRDRWLDCESDLEPINIPAPVVRDEIVRQEVGKPGETAAERER
jgi:hypothetical protein